MNSLQCCICRCVTSRRFLHALQEAVEDDEDESVGWNENENLLACLELTEHGIDLLLEGLAHDRTAEQLFRLLVEGRQVCVNRFWNRFPETLLTWARYCRWQKILGHVDIRKLDAGSQRMLRRLNRDANAEFARRLVRLDPAQLASRIDGDSGLPHANIVTIYTVAYILRQDQSLWRRFKNRLAEMKASGSYRPDIGKL